MTLCKSTSALVGLAFARLEQQSAETYGVRFAGLAPTGTDATIV